MAPRNSPYASRVALESIKQSSHADGLPILDEMLLWTPEEARAYFESNGQSRPEPAEVARRSPEDEKPPGDQSGPRQLQRDLIWGCLCPCCDQIVADRLEQRRLAKEQEGMPPASGGAPPSLAISR